MGDTVADTLARALAWAGLSPCFGYHGHHVEPLPQALVRAGWQVVIAASETGAGYISLGSAIVARRPALAFCAGSPVLAR
jgi:thiamine pyrophosphate-dependent acetolactate synthase large subunit-like protein